MNIPAVHPVQWATPAPLWSSTVAAGTPATGVTPQMLEPALLTIADDNFMNVLATALSATEVDLQQYLAVAKSYRVRPPGEPDDWEPPGTELELKLYQAAHGHFNLVATSLVCQVPGLPEHQVHPELKEQVGFVIRRYDEAGESAWTSNGAAIGWQPIDTGATGTVASGEQLLPLFPVKYTLEDHARTLFVGLVPTSSVETFNTAATIPNSSSSAGEPAADLMQMAFHTRVSAPLAQLILNAPDANSRVSGAPGLLLEFASFLNDWFPTSWQAITGGGSAAPANQPMFATLAVTIAGTSVQTDANGVPVPGPTYQSTVSWLDALTDGWQQAAWLSGEAVPVPNNPLALDLDTPSVVPAPGQTPIWTTLETLIDGATPEGQPAGAEGQPVGGANVPGAALATAPKYDPDPSNPAQYVIRCVYRRPECILVGDVVSGPTESFQIAPFFDFDAPARPVTISLPQVNKLSDLRKFQRNVNFLFTKELHSQMNRIIDLKSTMNGTLNPPSSADGLNVKWVCSFSISIVFIVAIFLLLMFVIMLNLFFFWLPFFEICLPVPE